MVERHEREARVDLRVDDREVEAEALGDARPVAHAGATHRIDAELEPRALDGLDVDDARQVLDVRLEKIVFVRRRRLARLRVRRALDARDARAQELVGARLHDVGDVGVGRPAVGRVVLEAAVARRVVRGRDDDAVGEPAGRCASVVVREDRARQRGRGREAGAARLGVVGREEGLDAVRGEDLEGRLLRGRRGGVRVDAEKERPRDAGPRAVLADGLRDGQDVRLVEGAVLGRAAVAARPEADELRGSSTSGARDA